MERTIQDCQRKWKSLRDRYVRELKKVRAKKSGTAGPVHVSQWCFFEVLSFLKDTVKHKKYVLIVLYMSGIIRIYILLQNTYQL